MPVDPRNNDESWLTKTMREGELIIDGTAGGVARTVSYIGEHPYAALGQVGLGAAFGVGMTLLSRRLGPSSIAWQGLKGGLLGTSVATLIADGEPLATAFSDNWHSGANFERNKEIVSGAVAPVLADTAMLTTGSLAGAAGMRMYGARFGGALAVGETPLSAGSRDLETHGLKVSATVSPTETTGGGALTAAVAASDAKIEVDPIEQLSREAAKHAIRTEQLGQGEAKLTGRRFKALPLNRPVLGAAGANRSQPRSGN